MKRLFSVAAATSVLAVSLACGGASGPAEPAFGTVAFQTYNGGRTRIKFQNDTNVKITWRNMSGSAVEGTWTQDGDEVVLDWGEPTNTATRISKMRQLDDCQLVQYYRLDDEGVEHADDSKMFIKDDDRCRR
ncbi:MAG: hypothetical protein KC912_12170 [Proteobacteria bacterium]|nr:hypothetical protein [Pseudomonadota bacterium]